MAPLTAHEIAHATGGRVLGVTATGDNLGEALSTCYRELAKISFRGMQYRRDIGK